MDMETLTKDKNLNIKHRMKLAGLLPLLRPLRAEGDEAADGVEPLAPDLRRGLCHM